MAAAGDRRLAKGADTKRRILDAAERLFAAQGFDGVSLRAIAAEAEVSLALVGFHGGPKETLFASVVERRATELSRLRLEALARAGDEASLDDVVRAFIEPYAERAAHGGPQWRAYARLIAHVSADPRWAPLTRRLFDPAVHAFIAAARAARPDADPRRMATAFVFSASAMLALATSLWRVDELTDRTNRSRDEGAEIAAAIPWLIDFCLGGIARTLNESA